MIALTDHPSLLSLGSDLVGSYKAAAIGRDMAGFNGLFTV
jgi:hypothetical protein